MKDRKKEFTEILGISIVDEESVVSEEKQRKTVSFSRAVSILLRHTEEGPKLKKEREDGLISGKEFQKRLIELSKKYRELILE